MNILSAIADSLAEYFGGNSWEMWKIFSGRAVCPTNDRRTASALRQAYGP
jgi:hypothetical protein